MVPSVEECFEFMEVYRMPAHIRDHSVVVEKIATLLTSALRDAGLDLSLERVRAGALMHDIAKSLCLDSGEDHSAKGREICLENGLDEIADIVGDHVRIKSHRLQGPVSEAEVVFYADKRVNHDVVVSLEERLEYLLERYGKGIERYQQSIRQNFETCRLVEAKIFRRLEFEPADVPVLVRTSRLLKNAQMQGARSPEE
jgi:uncharacterized protein